MKLMQNNRETYWPLWLAGACLALSFLFSGCTYYNPKTGRYFSVLKNVQADEITISTNELTIKGARSTGDAKTAGAAAEGITRGVKGF